MRLVAYTELLILVRVILGAFLLQNSLLAPIAYAHFVRARYFQSPFTQRAAAHLNLLIDNFIRKPGRPPIVASVWDKLRAVLRAWTGNVLVPQTPDQAGGRR